jgi:hypothetical protein
MDFAESPCLIGFTVRVAALHRLRLARQRREGRLSPPFLFVRM